MHPPLAHSGPRAPRKQPLRLPPLQPPPPDAWCAAQPRHNSSASTGDQSWLPRTTPGTASNPAAVVRSTKGPHRRQQSQLRGGSEMVMSWSFLFSCRYGCCYGAMRNFINVNEIAQGHLLRALRRLESKDVGWHVRPPLFDSKRVLRRAGQGLAGDHILARYRTGTGLDPNLPIGVHVTECEMFALNAIDDADADMFRLDHIRHQDVVGSGE